ncbi:MAG TPA: hypothetical protein VGX95_07450 [Xanthobacteraceae bacterium]|jgi:hypothetical protein|nr:hypothetical protein [Xanthobacteraceae bacterium]
MRFVALLFAFAFLYPLQGALAVDAQDCDGRRYAIGHSEVLCLHQMIDFPNGIQPSQGRRDESFIDLIVLSQNYALLPFWTASTGTSVVDYLHISWIVPIGEKKGASINNILANKHDAQRILISDNEIVFGGIISTQPNQKTSQLFFRFNRSQGHNVLKASTLRDCGINNAHDIKWTAEFLEYACRTPHNIIIGDMDFTDAPRFDALRRGDP